MTWKNRRRRRRRRSGSGCRKTVARSTHLFSKPPSLNEERLWGKTSAKGSHSPRDPRDYLDWDAIFPDPESHKNGRRRRRRFATARLV